MRKSLDYYMNDPEVINAPLYLRELYAIRLQISDETIDLTPEEHVSYFHDGAENFFAQRKALA